MKYVQFINTDDKGALSGSMVSAWSVRKYGCLPTDTEFILYTSCSSNIGNPDLHKVYDYVLPPTKNTEILDRIDWAAVPARKNLGWYQTKFRTGKVCWTKFLCFLGTECDGEPVIYMDYDTLCLGSLYKTIPYGSYTWSGVLWGKDQCNGGFIVKTDEFDKSDAPEKMLEPITNPDCYEEAFNLCPCDDEGGMKWYLSKYDRSTFLSLPHEYNYGTACALKNNKSINDLKMLHYICVTKPWLKPDKKYQIFTDKWNSEMKKMKEELNIE